MVCPPTAEGVGTSTSAGPRPSLLIFYSPAAPSLLTIASAHCGLGFLGPGSGQLSYNTPRSTRSPSTESLLIGAELSETGATGSPLDSFAINGH